MRFFPQITLPTRLSERRGTIIDNFLYKISDTRSNLSSSGIITSRISDHFPYFMCLDILHVKYDEVPKHIKSRPRHKKWLENFRKEIENAKLYSHINQDLNTDPNQSYTIIHTTIIDALDKHLLIIKVKYKKHKHKKSPWITQAIVRSVKNRDDKYKKLKRTPHDSVEYESLKINLQTYNKILKNSICTAKKMYYDTCFNKYKNDIKNTWSTINSILNRLKKKRSFPKAFNLDGLSVTDKHKIATSSTAISQI